MRAHFGQGTFCVRKCLIRPQERNVPCTKRSGIFCLTLRMRCNKTKLWLLMFWKFVWYVIVYTSFAFILPVYRCITQLWTVMFGRSLPKVLAFRFSTTKERFLIWRVLFAFLYDFQICYYSILHILASLCWWQKGW